MKGGRQRTPALAVDGNRDFVVDNLDEFRARSRLSIVFQGH